MNELVNNTQWNCRPAIGVQNGAEYRIGWDNFIDSSGQWRGINCLLNSILTGFELEDAPFYFKAPINSTGQVEITMNNRFDVFNKTRINAQSFDYTISCLGVESVRGSLYDIKNNGRMDSVLYENAYRTSFVGDLILYPQHGRAPRIKKLVRFNQAPATDVAILFELEYSSKMELTPRKLGDGKVRLQERDKWATTLSKDEKLYLHSDTLPNEGLYVRTWDESQKRGSGIKQPYIWDSSRHPITGLPKKWKIETYIERISGNKYRLTKIIPKAFFTGAVYPVYTDTTSTFYPDADPETTSVDGRVFEFQSGGVSWATIQSAAGTTASDSDTDIWAVRITPGSSVNLWRTIIRSIYLFDTSSLPDNDIISSGTLSIYGLSKADPSSITMDSCIYSSNPASNTALIAGDYDSLGTTELSNIITYGSWTTGAYNDFTLNSSGLSAIDKVGISKFGNRNDNYDANDSEPSPSSWDAGHDNGFFNYFADEAGTSKDPKLVVVHEPEPTPLLRRRIEGY